MHLLTLAESTSVLAFNKKITYYKYDKMLNLRSKIIFRLNAWAYTFTVTSLLFDQLRCNSKGLRKKIDFGLVVLNVLLSTKYNAQCAFKKLKFQMHKKLNK